MKKTLAVLALLFATASAVAATTAIRVTRHDGAGTGMALQTWTGGDEFVNLRACKEAVRKASASTPRVLSTCKVNYEDLYVAPPPPVVCPAASAPTTETVACPSGTTGTQTRTTTYTMGPPDACVQTATPGPLVGTCTPVVTPPPPPPPANAMYFSDCQAGAAAGCVPGSNANPGTLAAPKQSLAGINISTLPGGTTLLFKRGGSWNHSQQRLYRPVDGSGNPVNRNPPTAAAPLVFDAYGEGAQPILRLASGNAFETNVWTDAPPPATPSVGHLTIRNLKFDGLNTAEWVFWFRGAVENVLLENNTFTGFRIALNSQSSHPVRNITIRNNLIERNRAMGILGHYNDTVIEGNTFRANNFGGSNFDHASYIGGGRNIAVRNNVYDRNSTVNNTCTGGNMTFHGQIDGLLVEGNEIIQDASTSSCYGVSITRGYTTAEWFRNTVVRNNKVMNLGTGIVAQSAPGIVVDGNIAINTNINIGSGPNPGTGGDAGDVGDENARVTNNVICRTATAGSVTVNSLNSTVTGNVTRTGADATTGVCAR